MTTSNLEKKIGTALADTNIAADEFLLLIEETKQ